MDYSDLKINQKDNELETSSSENISFQLSLDDTPEFVSKNKFSDKEINLYFTKGGGSDTMIHDFENLLLNKK